MVKATQNVKQIEQKLLVMAGDCDTLPAQRTKLKQVLNEKRQKLRTNQDAVKQLKKESARLQNDRTTMADRIKDLEAR